jgi:hypothetical protein
LLPELASTINTTTSFALPRNKTPFEVWFSRKPHWIRELPSTQAKIGFYNIDANVDNDENSDQDYNDNDQEDDDDMDLVLTEIETRVVVNNACIHARMIKAHNSKSKEFKDSDIATLKIPPKLRLKTKAIRLLVRVLEYKNGQYKLQCRYGRLASRYQG